MPWLPGERLLTKNREASSEKQSVLSKFLEDGKQTFEAAKCACGWAEGLCIGTIERCLSDGVQYANK